jgi:tetratricopeptide (TPR) repeat protein
MERKNYSLIILIFVLSETLSANSGYSRRIYDAYINGKMEQWKTVLQEIEKHTPKSSSYLMEEVNYQYGYIGWCISIDKKNEAKIWMNKLEKNLNILEKKKFQPSMIASYRGSMIGFKIGLNKLQAPFIGGKSIEYAKSAMQLDPKNPLGYVLYGNILFYSPEFFGGSKEEAMSHYLLALKNMERNQVWIKENWNYLNLLTVIATAFYEYGEQEKALFYLKKTLEKEPDFQWVKKELYPKFQKRK